MFLLLPSTAVENTGAADLGAFYPEKYAVKLSKNKP